ncbi:glycosyltransferase [Paenisporosarcina indica]|uniref:glycosyltransferase n=1 Tax=Paenisporosarcina indica TaxID=650093 RepID=UPI00095028F4|nr:glycosyltransferase [Paenisporosarcina indica]
MKLIEKYLSFFVDLSIVVSNKLGAYIEEEYKVRNWSKYACSFDIRDWPVEEEYKKIREKVRKNLKISNETKVFVYGGSLAPWQCVEETIYFFKLLQKNKENIHLLFLTPEVELAKKMLSQSSIDKNDYTTLSVEPNDIKNYFIASDYGFLLRKNNLTNKVASPNKFAEYLTAGIKIIIGENVGEASEIVKNNNLGYLVNVDNLVVPEKLIAEIDCLEHRNVKLYRDIAFKYFNEELFAENLIEKLERVVNK